MSSTSYTATLSGTSPSVTLSTGATVMVVISASMTAGDDIQCYTGVSVNGGAPADGNSLILAGVISGGMSAGVSGYQASRVVVLTGMTPGSNTFELRYKAAGGTCTISNRSINVISF
jgi:hypothetical protein